MKFCGKVGFVITEETEPGIYEPKTVERTYRGEVLQNIRRWETGTSVNDNIKIQNRISIVADHFAHSNLGYMQYIEFANEKWKISSFDIKYPRIIITTGEVYNGTS